MGQNTGFARYIYKVLLLLFLIARMEIVNSLRGLQCKTDQFTCVNDEQRMLCISNNQRCDGKADCIYSRRDEDEGCDIFVVGQNDTVVDPGETAILECSIFNRSGRVQWIKDDVYFGYGTEIDIDKERLSMASPGNTVRQYGDGIERFDLTIKNAKKEDTGTYTCMVDGGKNAKATLTVTGGAAKSTAVALCASVLQLVSIGIVGYSLHWLLL